MPVTNKAWDELRRADGSIDLGSALPLVEVPWAISFDAFRYLQKIEAIQPIRSRQAAAIAVTTAAFLFRVES